MVQSEKELYKGKNRKFVDILKSTFHQIALENILAARKPIIEERREILSK